jgi:glycosyltransferase involved in cell wall biosynthesis
VRYALPALVRLIWKLRPHVVLATLVEPNLALLAIKPLLPRGPKLLVRETITVSERLAQSKRCPGIWRRLYRHLYPRADGIICVADFVLEDLAEQMRVPRSRMRRIYNPVDRDHIRRLAGQITGKSLYSGPGPHLVAAGRLSRQKGLDILLEALRRTRQALPTTDLVLVGEGRLETELTALRDRLGLREAVRFAGFQPNPYPYIQHADLLVLSSRYEGLPNVVLEALALGTPVVATDCPGGVRELLAPLGAGTCWLAPPEDPERLAEFLAAACAARRGMPRSVEEFETFIRPFGVETIVGEYEEFLAR